MINAPLEIPIFVHDDESIKIENLGIDYNVEDYKTELSTFYIINAIYPIKNNNGYIIGSYIITGNSEYMTPIKYENLKSLINKRI